MAWPQKRNLRALIGKRDGWHCHYCKTSLTLYTSTLDHVVPKALGGTLNSCNLRLACDHCNKAKADKPPHVFHALMMQGLVA